MTGFAYVSDLVMEIAEANGMETDAGMAATLKNTLDLYKTKIVETLGAAGYAGSSTVTGTLDSAMNDREALKELIQESFPDDPDMVAVYEHLFDNMTLEEGEFTDPERDPATPPYVHGPDLRGYGRTCAIRSICAGLWR